MLQLGVAPEQVDQVFLAGAFASAPNFWSAAVISLLVPVPAERVRQVGNASVRKAKALVLFCHRREELDLLVGRIEYVELGAERDFFRAVRGAALR